MKNLFPKSAQQFAPRIAREYCRFIDRSVHAQTAFADLVPLLTYVVRGTFGT